MIGILIALVISWLLLYFFERRNILALGFLPVGKRLKQFSIGFLFTATLCVLTQYLEAFLKSAGWTLNSDLNSTLLLKAFWWDVKSVFTEELVFRGALLYLLIHKLGSHKAIWISAIAFGIYHWFSYGVLGNVTAMILVFLGTGLMGFAFAWGFSKTKSIMFPFGLHLGWNFVYNSIFSKGPLGNLAFTLQGGHDLEGWPSLLNFTSGLIIVPICVILYVRFFVKEELEVISKT